LPFEQNSATSLLQTFSDDSVTISCHYFLNYLLKFNHNIEMNNKKARIKTMRAFLVAKREKVISLYDK